ncbi:hypothetical protein EYF80_037968 [Liparis tanakae]|uniref:Uncharacterized protein n=1 Tax=Liparis tanakae TaxID=230148 RepID=A0A4Z2GEU9_9TELE|nr:hypothetical protein EYF80_037968 [Liparis tanakae]
MSTPTTSRKCGARSREFWPVPQPRSTASPLSFIERNLKPVHSVAIPQAACQHLLETHRGCQIPVTAKPTLN